MTRSLPTAALATPVSTTVTEHGTIDTFELTDQYGAPRVLRMLKPPGYDANPLKKYPLLVMHDGQNVLSDDDAFMHRSWRVGEAFSAGRKSGVLRDVLVLGIDNARDHIKRAGEYTPHADDGERIGGDAARSAAWMMGTALPQVLPRYRVTDDPGERVIGGSSLGAVRSLFDAAMSGFFGGAMLMSGTFWWSRSGTDMAKWIASKWQSVPRGMKIWLSVGTDERELRLFKANERMHEQLRKIGFVESENLKFAELPGGHDEPSWRRQLNDDSKEGVERFGPLGFFFPA